MVKFFWILLNNSWRWSFFCLFDSFSYWVWKFSSLFELFSFSVIFLLSSFKFSGTSFAVPLTLRDSFKTSTSIMCNYKITVLTNNLIFFSLIRFTKFTWFSKLWSIVKCQRIWNFLLINLWFLYFDRFTSIWFNRTVFF